jgi:hypothetical protein
MAGLALFRAGLAGWRSGASAAAHPRCARRAGAGGRPAGPGRPRVGHDHVRGGARAQPCPGHHRRSDGYWLRSRHTSGRAPRVAVPDRKITSARSSMRHRL